MTTQTTSAGVNSPVGNAISRSDQTLGSALAPGAWLGVLGGGQLGRMWVHAAQSHGFRTAVLEPDPHSPAGAAADHHWTASYTDPAALSALLAQCAAVTTEFENVPALALRLLAQGGLVVTPAAEAVEVCQHRAREKQCFEQAGVACAPYMLIETATDLESPIVQSLLPGILKTARLGYDGKGQSRLQTRAELAPAWHDMDRVPCLLERSLDLFCEISVIVARGSDGHCVNLPVQQNLHRDGILAVTHVPAPDISESIAAQAVAQARCLAEKLHYVGVLCVEFFVLADGTLIANEMAPRPHNSGHWSLDGSDVSQFDLQLRVMAGWPLVAPRQHSAAVMLNLLGDLWRVPADRGDRSVEPDWPAVLALPGVHLYLYGKQQARPGRKMGHITVTAPSLALAQAQAERVSQCLGLPWP